MKGPERGVSFRTLSKKGEAFRDPKTRSYRGILGVFIGDYRDCFEKHLCCNAGYVGFPVSLRAVCRAQAELLLHGGSRWQTLERLPERGGLGFG